MKIWCVEDDNSIRDIEVYTLSQTGFEAEGFPDGEAFFSAMKSSKPDLVILDVMLPGEDGVEILKHLRSGADTSSIPVIMATAKGMEYDKIKTLDLGADDYLVKPFALDELLARIRVMMRHGSSAPVNTISVGDLVVDCAARTVTRAGKPINLTAKEFDVLEYMVRNVNTVLSRDRMTQHLWSFDYEGGSNVIDVYIRYLRKKIDDGHDKKLIHTVRGAGYVLREDE